MYSFSIYIIKYTFVLVLELAQSVLIYLNKLNRRIRINPNYIYTISTPQMKYQNRKIRKVNAITAEPDLRRSSRERKEPKNEDYFMGTTYIEEIFGYNHHEDQCYPKRRRKNYRYDDSEDYSQGHKYSKKSKQINPNKIEGLLEWKNQLEILPIIVNYLPDQQDLTPIQRLHKYKCSKNVSSENLSAIAEDIEAIFINIDWQKKNQTLKDFQQLKIQSNKLMSKGLVFVWAPKMYVSEMLSIMQKKQFIYVQNLQIINFDIQKAKQYYHSSRGNLKNFNLKLQDKNSDKTIQEELDYNAIIKSLQNVDPCQIIADQTSQFFNISKRTLLMFKKNNALKFQLRHQRTCDVVFDMPLKLGQKCDRDIKEYIYHMIQTLLPQCLIINQRKKNDYHYKMLEIWADKDEPRRGWVSIAQE